jgi:hypothetical protein
MSLIPGEQNQSGAYPCESLELAEMEIRLTGIQRDYREITSGLQCLAGS